VTVPQDHLGADAFRVTRPAYGTRSLADLLPSLSAVLGVPGADDVLGLRAHLDGVERVGLLLVDGLGAYQLPVLARHAPTLAGLAAPMTLTSGFPSTTPVSLVTLGTGALPGAHGILGFNVRLPDGRVLNHLRWGDDPDPATWQPVPTAFQTAAAAGVAFTTVTRPEFEGTGLTTAANRGAVFVGASDADALAERMLHALKAGPGLVYGYHPELDRRGHESGIDSEPWRAAAREVNDLVERLVTGLPAGSALLVTADHGQLNIPADQRIEMANHPSLSAGVVAVSGEARARYLHVAPGALDDVQAAWQELFGESARVLTRAEMIDDGWYGPVPPAHLDRIGDLVVVCLGRAVALATGWEPPSVARMVAFHGGVTATEMTVPLLLGS
jgi:type I phosphodiesterase/nucleotide pyrophosphatase